MMEVLILLAVIALVAGVVFVVVLSVGGRWVLSLPQPLVEAKPPKLAGTGFAEALGVQRESELFDWLERWLESSDSDVNWERSGPDVTISVEVEDPPFPCEWCLRVRGASEWAYQDDGWHALVGSVELVGYLYRVGGSLSLLAAYQKNDLMGMLPRCVGQLVRNYGLHTEYPNEVCWVSPSEVLEVVGDEWLMRRWEDLDEPTYRRLHAFLQEAVTRPWQPDVKHRVHFCS